MNRRIFTITMAGALASATIATFSLAQARKPAAAAAAKPARPPASAAPSADASASASSSSTKGDAIVSEAFVAYMKAAYNPPTHNLGLRDGRFYPYMTPFGGRRIGYRSPIPDKTLYRKGWSPDEAEAHLRADLDRRVNELRAHLKQKYPAKPFDALPVECREILLDLAYWQGSAAGVPDAVYKATIASDWKTLIGGMVYVRAANGSPDNTLNRAFADRWIYSKKLAR